MVSVYKFKFSLITKYEPIFGILDTDIKILNDFKAWNGWWDEASEGEWISIVNSSLSLSKESFLSWSIGEPNGQERENCGVISSEKNSWDDVSCFRKECAICNMPMYGIFVLRGKIQNLNLS